MKTTKISAILVLALGLTSLSLTVEGSVSTRAFARFKLTQESYNCNDTMETIVVTQFGPDAKVADWVTIKALFANNIESFCDSVGLTSYETGLASAAWCYYNGQAWYGGWRHYFVARHDHVVPGGWLVHDHINNHVLDLGSWCEDGMDVRILVDLGVPLVVDFNGNGIVDINDLLRIIESWGQDDPVVDMCPKPLGDGIVDEKDLEFFLSYWGKEVEDRTLISHWKLNEIEGDIASDSANDNDGTVYGDPAWQPEGGMVDGALQLDGIDDYVNTPFVLNPADGKFSVFVWIKGGAPGQAVLSQMGGSNWLCTDSVEGDLMTEIEAYGRDATGPLLSQTVITDGNWHRIGLVWDGSQRTLYVDDIAVAQDAQPDLAASENGLYIGTDMSMEAGSFWSGLIDDVRIYNRAVIP